MQSFPPGKEQGRWDKIIVLGEEKVQFSLFARVRFLETLADN